MIDLLFFFECKIVRNYCSLNDKSAKISEFIWEKKKNIKLR